MRPFNCLSADCSIFGPHLLEASAGTGKTFSIEHVVVRLLLESDEIELEQILVVTFTRAATRDLKKRIRSNLQEALACIRSGKKGWEYLDVYLGSERAVKKLEDAILLFDRSQVFTIHGFCHRMLQEFAFEAGLGFSLRDSDREALLPKRIYKEAKKFMECGISPDLVCPEQMAIVLKECDTLDELIDCLLKKKFNVSSSPFSQLLERYTALFSLQNQVEASLLLEAFHRVQSSYKSRVKGNFERQIYALASSKENPSESFRTLIRDNGTLFAFLDPSNKKIKAKIDCPGFFEWAIRTIGPLIEEAINCKWILGCLQKAWKEIEEPIYAEELFFGPDEILKRMKESLGRASFATGIRKKYRAAIIDEFQDTDPLQWEIFKILFLSDLNPIDAFYLVGDPKQSIYRFRKADIYTYFEARSLLGPTALYCLDTNYRSTPTMISALNALFDRSWLSLPKLGAMIPCSSVKAGLTINSDFSDEKGAVHFMIVDSFENGALPYAIGEIERLLPMLKSPGSFAILVKDRYQAEIVLRSFQERSIPAIARSHVPLGKTLAFQSVRELFEAIAFPRNRSLSRMVAAGPFEALNLNCVRIFLEKEGLISFCRQILNQTMIDTEFQRDLKQVIEELLIWEGRFGFSLKGILQFLDEFAELDSDEGGRRRIETDVEAVQILTLHVSKGLEFDIVFALGLASRPPEETEEAEEAEAEKLRQLYVAMTRAKKRLYVPLPIKEKKGSSLSPMELFGRLLENQEGDLLSFLKKIDHITWENLPGRVSLSPLALLPKTQLYYDPSPRPPIPSVSPCFIHSFTSLAQRKPKEAIKSEESSILYTPHTIPRGVETGNLIHQIFELLLSAPLPIWKDLGSFKSMVAEQLRGTFLLPWEEAIKEMIWNALHLTIPLEKPFSLAELNPGQLQVEMEFLYSESPHFVKGFIDLVFLHEGKFYFLDWKTNWLGPDDMAYLFLEGAMTIHDYWLQAKLYAEALRRHVKRFYMQPFHEIFGGAIYLFLRGGGVCYFKPDLKDD